MKQKLVFSIPEGCVKPPWNYILTPELIPLGAKFKLGPNKTLHTRFIKDHSIVKKLIFSDNDESDHKQLDSEAEKLLLAGGFGKFSFLGKGGFGSVCVAVYKNELVAIKTVKLDNESRRQSIQREHNGLGLQHPNVVQMLAVLHGPKCGYVVMRRGASTTLQTYISSSRNGHIRDRLKISYMEQACKGLQYLHELGILHLDVKPLNMLVDDKYETLQLCDFGNSTLTPFMGKMRTMGTVRYAAPELLMGKSPTTKSDIFSIGISMWQVLFHRVPYSPEKNDAQLILQIPKNCIRPEPEDHPFAKQVKGMRIYQEIYKTCWRTCPDRRPTLEAVLGKLLESKECLNKDGRWKEATKKQAA